MAVAAECNGKVEACRTIATLLNFLKVSADRLKHKKFALCNFQSMIGPATLSLPLALKTGGLLAGVFLIAFFGLVRKRRPTFSLLIV